MYYNARYYVPGIGRFASADTIVPDFTNPQSFNRYSYSRNNPVNFVDPTGHWEIEDDPTALPPVSVINYRTISTAFLKPYGFNQAYVTIPVHQDINNSALYD